MVFIGKSREFFLHRGAGESTFQNAYSLRQNMTESEKMLWDMLKNRKFMGLKFRRQHPLNLFIADFYCHEKRLVIEVDGEIHDQEEIKEHDLNRSAELNRLGISVIRFTNEQIQTHPDQVVNEIGKYIKGLPTPNPPSP